MGCCVSTSASAAARRGRPDAAGAAAGNSARSGTSGSAARAGRDHHHHDLVLREGNKPLRRRPLLWASEHPMTMSQLRAAREAFWETAPSYEGRIEIWQALRLACECEDLALAQAIVSSANIMVPTGDLSEGCYDELGNRYMIPQYCFAPPTNLVASEGGCTNPAAGEDANTIAGTDDEKSGAKGKSRHSSSSSPSVRTDETTAATLAAAEKSAVSPALERALTVRLSTGTDLKLRVAADEKIAGLRKKVLDALQKKEKGEDEEESGGAATGAAAGGGAGGGGGERDAGDGRERAIKFFFLGRMLGDKVRLRELKLPDHGGIVQALLPPP